MIKVLTMALLIFGVASAQNSPQIVPSAIEAGYVPLGYDSNDNVQIVIEGYYRDTCSKPAGTQFKVDPISKTIEIFAYEYRYSGQCLDVIVPHDEVVSLGILQPGLYKIYQTNGRPLGLLNIKVANKLSPDDYLYAPITQAYLKSNNGKVSVTVSGTFTNSCMKLSKVLAQTQNNVIALQPLAEVDQGGRTQCVQGSFPFEHTIMINSIKPGRYLLHVRSLNGKSINNLFDVNVR